MGKLYAMNLSALLPGERWRALLEMLPPPSESLIDVYA